MMWAIASIPFWASGVFAALLVVAVGLKPVTHRRSLNDQDFVALSTMSGFAGLMFAAAGILIWMWGG